MNDPHLQYYALMTQTNFEMGISKSRFWCEIVEKLESVSDGAPTIESTFDQSNAFISSSTSHSSPFLSVLSLGFETWENSNDLIN